MTDTTDELRRARLPHLERQIYPPIFVDDRTRHGIYDRNGVFRTDWLEALRESSKPEQKKP